MDTGIVFTPKYVRQESDLSYGEKVTHENYNEKLNLNTTQGDYNTYILEHLFGATDPEEIIHIPYLDAGIEDATAAITGLDTRTTNLENAVVDINDDLLAKQTIINNIINGSSTVGKAHEADKLAAIDTVGPNKYYGTDSNNNKGFLSLPDFLYAVPMESSTGVDGIEYLPALNSVTEAMLTEELRSKINSMDVNDYEALDNKPSINNVELVSNISLEDIGAQPVGSYVTNTELATTLSSYYTIAAAQEYMADNYATISALDVVDALATSASTAASAATVAAATAQTTANARARVGINTFVTNPQNGDLYIEVA